MQFNIGVNFRTDCFACLPSQLVNELYEREEFTNSTSSVIAIELSSLDQRIFVGWGGGGSQYPKEVEIPREFATCLGLNPGQQVLSW